MGRRQLKEYRQQMRNAAASFLQAKTVGAMAVREAQITFWALREEHLLLLQVHKFQLSLNRVLERPHVALFQVSDLLRNTSGRVKASKHFSLIVNDAVAACLRKNHYELVKVLMDHGVFLDLEGINVENVNVWLSRETPQSTLDHSEQDHIAPTPTGAGDTQGDSESQESPANQDAKAEQHKQAQQNLELARRVNAWLLGVTPDNTVTKLHTALSCNAHDKGRTWSTVKER